MKARRLLPLALLALTACSDYDNGFDSKAIRFAEDFRNKFGNIDPEQDWNLAERATVTVTTSAPTDVKIYAPRGNSELCLVGYYKAVSGTKVLGVDVVEGTKRLVVSDGANVVETTPGGSANFNGTRTVHEKTNIQHDWDIKVQELTGDVTIQLSDNEWKEFPQYMYMDEKAYENVMAVVPEIGKCDNARTNLDKVTCDFTYVSNGDFIIYPYYWNTLSKNTVGVYYIGNNGNIRKRPIYTACEDNELQYLPSVSQKVGSVDFSKSESDLGATGNVSYLNNITLKDDPTPHHYFMWTGTSWNGLEDLKTKDGQPLPTGDLSNGELKINCIMKGKTKSVRVIFSYKDNENEKRQTVLTIQKPNPNDDGAQTVNKTFYLSDASLELDKNILKQVEKVELYGGDDNKEEFKSGGGAMVLGDVELIELTLKNRIDSSEGEWTNFAPGNGSDYPWDYFIRCPEIFSQNRGTMVRGKGIRVSIPKGRQFGMYLEKVDNGKTYTFYSQSELNDPALVGPGRKVINGVWTDDPGDNPCYASTFTAKGKDGNSYLFLGFEDWPNDGGNKSDFDLNDLVFAFDGCTPSPLVEEAETGGSWILACEDLGGSFDIDYNDLVLKVTHISGQTFATVTPLAAGGTLASYIYFHDPKNGNNDQVVGEIHQLFGASSSSMTSGQYDPINAGANRGNPGKSVKIRVAPDWTMAWYATGTTETNGVKYEGYNMGGFEIRTLPAGTEVPQNTPDVDYLNSHNSGASRIQAPNEKGKAPYILCIPYSWVEAGKPAANWQTEHVWSWPQELQPLSACYKGFGGSKGFGSTEVLEGWVQDHTKNTDWWKKANDGAAVVSSLSRVVPMLSNTPKAGSTLSVEDVPGTVSGEINLRNYINTTSTGQLHVEVKKADGSTLWSADVAPDQAIWFTPTVSGELKVYVNQKDDDFHEASNTLSFTMNVKAVLSGKLNSEWEFANASKVVLQDAATGLIFGFYDNNKNCNASMKSLSDAKDSMNGDTNIGIYFTKEQKTVDNTTVYQLQAKNKDMEATTAWGWNQHLNSTNYGKGNNFAFGLGNNVTPKDGVTHNNGVDLDNGGVWIVNYVSGKGFTIQNVATKEYLNGNRLTEAPHYWNMYTGIE